MRAGYAMIALAACGRFGFGAISDANDGLVSNGDAAPVFDLMLGAGPSWIRALAKLPDGAIAIGGYYSGATSLGTIQLPYVGGEDMLIAVVDPTGVVRWAHGFGSVGDDEVRGVAVAADGTIFVTGLIGGAVSLGGPTLPSANAFIASFAADGTYRWSHSFGGGGTDHGVGMFAAADTDMVVCGGVTGAVDFGDGTVTPPSTATRDMFVARFMSDGTLRWAKRWGSAGFNTFTDVAEDASGNLYLGGGYAGSVDFGGGAIPYRGSQDAIVLSLSAGGSFRWNQTFGGTDYERIRSIAINDQTVVVGGYYNGAIDLGVSAAADGNIVLASYSLGGVAGWAIALGGTGCDTIERVNSTPTGFLVGGRFTGTITLGGGTHVSSGGADALVFELSPSGVASSVVTFGGTMDDSASGVLARSGAPPIVAGYRDEPATASNCVGTGNGLGELVAANAFLEGL